jgi:hypothetical protein
VSRIACAQSASSMFMWKMSSVTPQLPPTSLASWTAWSARLRKYVSNRLSGSSPIRTPTCSACAWHSLRPWTAQSHSSSGEAMGTTLPTVEGTIVRILPPRSETSERQSLTYCTLAMRT